ncbi:MAG: hypothetical protein NVSMB63_07120 [Sediminibacterium sp.]
MTIENSKRFLPLVCLFLLVSILILVFPSQFAQYRINSMVVMGANLVLLLISALSVLLQLRSVKKNNPYAMVRSVMGSMILKLFGLGAAFFIYVYQAGAQRSDNAIYAGMALYLLYTWVEVHIVLRLNPGKHAGN